MKFLDQTGLSYLWSKMKGSFIRTVNGVGPDANGNVAITAGLPDTPEEYSFTAGQATAIGKNYRILRDGMEIARAVQTSQYAHEEDAEAHKVAGAIPVQGFYRIWTREENLDLVFVTILAFARSGASDDRGGSYGAVLGTIKNIGSK